MSTGEIIIIRGGGDLATGVIQKFYRSGFKVLILETGQPTAIRRSVALCEAVYSGYAAVEDVTCRCIDELGEMEKCHQHKIVPMIIDPAGESIAKIKPAAVIDAILAKRNLGTKKEMAPVTIGLGPGFYAGQDVHGVIETMRGHDLGRLILDGSAMPNTGIPGEIGGQGARRVIHAPAAGAIKHLAAIGDIVDEGQTIFRIAGRSVTAPFNGLIRGLIRDGMEVPEGLKVADIDPRQDVDWQTISDKARCLGGAALEGYLYLRNHN